MSSSLLSRTYPAARRWKDQAKHRFFACMSMRGYAVYKRDAIGVPRQIATAKTWANAKAAVDVLIFEEQIVLAGLRDRAARNWR